MHPTIARSCILMVLAVGPATASAAVQFTDVFVGGGEGSAGTPYYRVPSVIVAPNGDLIALAEARRGQGGDAGEPGAPIDLVCKRSTDGGASWSSYNVIAHNNQFDYSDPRPVVDAATGKVLLLYTQWPDNAGAVSVPAGIGPESSVIYCRSSSDNGQTWADPVNINAQVKDPAWFALVSNVGVGIQLRWQTDPARNGRLVGAAWLRDIPGDGSSYHYKDVALYSDDHGANWNRSKVIDTPESSEDQVVELTNGDLMLDARQIGGEYRRRSISHDGGATWGPVFGGDIKVTDDNCALLRYSAKRDGDDRDRILFSCPLGDPAGAGNGRSNLGVWTSYDEGKTFINPVQIDSGWAAYSSMQKLRDGSIGLLYEKTGNTLIRLAKFGLADLELSPRSRHLAEYDGFGNSIDPNRGGIGWSGSWTGTGTATNAYSARLGGTGLQFAGSPFPIQDGRMDLTPGHTTAERQFATPINLNMHSTTYIAVWVSQALDAGNLSGKPLDIQLRDASEVSRVAFGINGNERFYISDLGNNVQNAASMFDGSATYLVVLKIASQDAGQPGNFDQVFLKVFQSGVDAIPLSDAGLTWTLVGSTDVNSSAILDRIALTSGSTATWSFDELRIGDSFGAVASNASVPEPKSIVLSASGLLGLLAYAWQRRWQGSAILW